MAGDCFGEGAGAKIDRFGDDRDSEPREERARDAKPRAAPQKAAHHRCGGQPEKPTAITGR